MNTELIFKAINWISKNNPSNHLPYHGIDHLYMVFEQCMKIYHTDVKLRMKVTHLAELYIAALFHDYNHSGGKLSDSENIENAINGVIEFLNSVENNLDVEVIKFLIKSTQYPAIIESSQLTPEAMIIQDADMCYLFENISIVKLYTGLRNEFNQDLETFYKNQEDFLKSVKFNTDYAIERWPRILDRRLEELEMLKNTVV